MIKYFKNIEILITLSDLVLQLFNNLTRKVENSIMKCLDIVDFNDFINLESINAISKTGAAVQFIEG